MRLRRSHLMMVGLLATVFSLGVTIPAYAAPPPNDDFDNATVITGLPFTDTISTVEATTAPDDPDCAGTSATVWYVFTPDTDLRIQADTFGSDYDTTLSVYTGTRGNLTQLACNDDLQGLQSGVRFDAVAGTTYFFMVGAFDGLPGGNLVFHVLQAPPPLTVELTVDQATVDQSGVVTLTGTLTCNRPALFAEVSGTLSQRKGRFQARGFFFTDAGCSPAGEPWSATLTSDTGTIFLPGRATIEANATACDGFECVSDSVSGTIRLQRSR
jgi:hypothetical protein